MQNLLRKIRTWARKHLGAILVVSVVAVLALIGVTWYNNTMNTGYEKQRKVVTLQRAVETEISTCLDTGATAAQVATQQLESVRGVLVDTVSARYSEGSSAEAALQGGAFVSAMHENYPIIDTTTWKVLMGVVVGCRQDVRDDQDNLQRVAGEFDTWRQTGGIIETWFRNAFPDERLSVKHAITGETLTGERALEYLTKVISVEEAKKAMGTGTMPGQTLFPTQPQPTR